ncbi:hypothetical protein HL667_30185 [Bradyrhizobium sp. 83012]|uniref:Uncharacterized protein n=2 Tax=Bradyrhizobium aeschynomenes TaxID=2734909 RepID=A0ABX2CMF2_9BRAD|nr:hypothetical protein [Bradyrhizobium aeschynomenes]NPU69308.1 hypothetical protein [Bradyrhizobium aeschynomenes]
MTRDDLTCRCCRAGLQRIELHSQRGAAGDRRCPACDALLETVDGATEVVYRLMVVPERIFDARTMRALERARIRPATLM